MQDTQNLKLIGNISLTENTGVLLYGENGPVRDVIVRDGVVVEAKTSGFALRYTTGSKVERCTALGASGTSDGFGADDRRLSDGGAPIFFSDLLATSFAVGFEFVSVRGRGTHLNAFATGEPYYPATAFQNTQVSDPRLGNCKVFIPAGSPMKNAGSDGGDIGANVLFRTENAVLTKQPLWDPATGSFPCGAIVQGINDRHGESCFDVHLRLDVGTRACPLPESYRALAVRPVARFDQVLQNVQPGALVTLDASSSTAPPGASLTAFEWEHIRGPKGVRLSTDNLAQPTQKVQMDEPGRYVFRLVVQDSNSLRSAPAVAAVEVTTPPSCSVTPLIYTSTLLLTLLLARPIRDRSRSRRWCHLVQPPVPSNDI